MAETDATSVFTRALNVINAALEKHADAMPYKALIQGSEKVLSDRNIGVSVYEKDPKSPFDYFTIRFRDGSFELVSHGKQEPEMAWNVSRDYLEKVAENADDYIQNPVKLDWDWLKDRVGISD